ncbi:MAG: hypothetical protein KJN62_05195 [Deltaproteobacteria bacterium]|nr:hypothetical protein [Deltaproteobacteria bacterium]
MEDRNNRKYMRYKRSSLFSTESEHDRSNFFISDSDEVNEEFFEATVEKEKKKHRRVSDGFFLSDYPWED